MSRCRALGFVRKLLSGIPECESKTRALPAPKGCGRQALRLSPRVLPRRFGPATSYLAPAAVLRLLSDHKPAHLILKPYKRKSALEQRGGACRNAIESPNDSSHLLPEIIETYCSAGRSSRNCSSGGRLQVSDVRRHLYRQGQQGHLCFPLRSRHGQVKS